MPVGETDPTVLREWKKKITDIRWAGPLHPPPHPQLNIPVEPWLPQHVAMEVQDEILWGPYP